MKRGRQTTRSKSPRPLKQGRYTPTVNSNDEEAKEGNIALIKIDNLERYIHDNFEVIVQKANEGPGLRISAKPSQFKRKDDGEIFNRKYSYEANLYYPDGDDYIMSELGIRRTPKSPRRKSRKNTPHSKNVGRPTRVSNLRIRIPKTPATPEKKCSICTVSRKARKTLK